MNEYETDEIVREFLVESCENVDQADRDLVALEKDPTAKETLASIFRAVHTLKGTSGFLGYAKLESIAHVGESLLSRLRDGTLLLDPEITSGLLAMIDAVRTILASIESHGKEGDHDLSQLIELLTRLKTKETSAAVPVTAASPATLPAPASAPPVPVRVEAVPEGPQASPPAPPATPPVPVQPEEVQKPSTADVPIGELLVRDGAVSREQVADAVQQQIDGDPRHLGEILVDRGVVAPAAVLDALQEQKNSRASTPSVSSSTIRVDVQQLDKLMNLVGELVLCRNQVLQYTATQEDPALLSASQRLNLITSELQEGVMKTRMQPIDNVWNKFPRVVRDLAAGVSKQVMLEMEGKETELDKTILEAIKDPLTHIVRNSIDHGIESPEKRVAAGKSPQGRISLRAFHEGGQVNIEISDDGAGINFDRVKRKAVERGLISPEQAQRLSEREALNLLFLPGFSTAEKVTNISGRGVGMDVVRTNIEKIGGTVDLHSRPGEGTTLKIKIPLTLAIIPALIVTSGGDRYAIPQVNLLELVRVEDNEVHTQIETIHGAPVYRLRGNLLPLVYLDRQLKIESSRRSGATNIVVLDADSRQFGLVVDEVTDTEEIVVKPLGNHMKGITTFAGATIMGDGRVALILDVLGLAYRASVLSEHHGRTVKENAGVRASAATQSDKQALLLFRTPDDGRMAIPLSLVKRLEEFPKSAIESTGSQEVVQYRGEILPLACVGNLLSERRRQPRRPIASGQNGDGKLQVVVYSEGGRHVGLVVDRIIDIVEETLTALRPATRKGVLGSLVIQSRVTEILDIKGLIQSQEAVLFGQAGQDLATEKVEVNT